MMELIYWAATVHRMFFNPLEVQQCTLLSIKTGGCTELGQWEGVTHMLPQALMRRRSVELSLVSIVISLLLTGLQVLLTNGWVVVAVAPLPTPSLTTPMILPLTIACCFPLLVCT